LTTNNWARWTKTLHLTEKETLRDALGNTAVGSFTRTKAGEIAYYTEELRATTYKESMLQAEQSFY
jgi:hypothetical protein